MKTNEIKEILESFYEGQTTPEEELLLKKYFNGSEVADELLEEKEPFLSFFDHQPLNMPSNLETKIENLIDRLEEQEKKTKLTFRNIVKWTSIAACVTLLLSTGIYLNKISITKNDHPLAENANNISTDEVMKVKNALALLSSNFNKGLDQIDEVKGSFEKTNNILDQTFNKTAK